MKKNILGGMMLLPVVCWAENPKEITIQITPELCQHYMINAVPDADVTYKAGVDAQGDEVTPADLNGAPPLKVPSTTEIPIRIDVRKYTGGTPQNKIFDKKGELGSVEAHTDGRLYYNGQPLFGEHEARIRKACEVLLKKE